MPAILLPIPKKLVQSGAHARARGLIRRASFPGLLDGLIWLWGSIASLLLTFLGLEESKRRLGFWMLAVFAVLLLIRLIRRGQSNETMRRQILWACLSALHEQVFKNSNGFRFTFFICDPLFGVRVLDASGRKRTTEILVPLLRKESGQTSYERIDSSAYYPRTSKAVTAVAWSAASDASRIAPDNMSPWLVHFPEFQSREDMIHHYRTVLKIEPEICERISDWMIDVRSIFSFPLVDGHGIPMGLLSIDSRKAITDAETETDTGVIDSKLLVNSLQNLRAVLMYTGFGKHN